MINKTIVSFFIILCGMAFHAAAQDLSHKGKNFRVSYPNAIQDVEMILYVGAGNRAAVVTVTATSETGIWQKVYNVPANTVIQSDIIPRTVVLGDATGFERVYNRCITIESDVPIVSYAHYYNDEYSGSTLLIPEETWGYSYVTMDSPGDNNGFVDVVVSHDNTAVEIIPAVVTSAGHAANTPYTITLNKGQVYQIVTALAGGELTGTNVRSVANSSGTCYPVAVFSGALGAPICGMTSDFMISQLFPSPSWGKRYLTAPFSTSLSNGNSFNTAIFRVQVKDPATVVKLNGVTLTGLTPNLYYEFRSNTADYIEASQPVTVVQFMTSQSTNGSNCIFNGVGDPEMIALSPLEQATPRSDFYLPYKGDILYNYVTLIIPSAGLASLKINGSNTFSFVYAHPSLPGYAVVINRWIAAGKSCTVQSDSAFTGITYGLSAWNTYGFNITSLKNLAGTVELSNKPDAGLLKDSTCTGLFTKLVFKTGYQPTRIEWQLGGVPGLSPNANVVLNNPVPDSTVTEYNNLYYIYSTPQYYTFKTPGIVTVPVVVTTPSIGSCDNTQTFTGYLKVNAGPVAAFSGPAAICMPEGQAALTNQSSYPETGIALQYQWDFGDGSGATSASPAHHYTAAASGPVALVAKAPNGCSDTAVKIIPFVNRPKAGFTVSDSVLCGTGPVSFTDTSAAASGSSINNWSWSMGDGSTAVSPSPVKQYQPGSYTVQQFVTSTEGCVSDTAVKTIQVYALPKVDAGPDQLMQQGGAVKLQGSADATASVKWSPAAYLDNPAILTPLAGPPADQLYYLTATTANKCTAYDSVWIRILLNLRVPNAFSPNGDGVNDVWEIPGLNSYPDAVLQVFNRWGQKVFESKGYARPWNGMLNGQPLPVGTYYYVLDPGYKKPRQSGSVTILR